LYGQKLPSGIHPAEAFINVHMYLNPFYHPGTIFSVMVKVISVLQHKEKKIQEAIDLFLSVILDRRRNLK
jgi:hypothetical protein